MYFSSRLSLTGLIVFDFTSEPTIHFELTPYMLAVPQHCYGRSSPSWGVRMPDYWLVTLDWHICESPAPFPVHMQPALWFLHKRAKSRGQSHRRKISTLSHHSGFKKRSTKMNKSDKRTRQSQKQTGWQYAGGMGSSRQRRIKKL